MNFRQNMPNRRDNYSASSKREERDDAMTSNTNRETAKIYQFPAGGRAALRTDRPLAKPVDEMQAAAASRAIIGGSWYHEEAIRETEPVGKQ